MPSPPQPRNASKRSRLQMLGLACLASALLHCALIRFWPAPPTAAASATPIQLQLALHRAETATAAATDPAPESLVAPTQPSAIQPTGSGVRSVLQVSAATVVRAPAPAMTAQRVRLRPPQRVPITLAHAAPPAAQASEHARVLQRWLEQHRFYPRAARRAGIEGVVHLRFQLQRNGMPTQAQVTVSSGAALLDRAALALLRQASPLPWPADLEATAIEVDVPVAYALRSGARPQ